MSEPATEGANRVATGSKNFLMQKVGPLPLVAWIAAGLVIWFYFSRKSASTTTAPIDPATGFPTGSPEDQAALAANAQQNATTPSTPTGQPGQTYTDNNAWARAAINYLDGLGIDPTQANQAVELYITSQTLTTQQQGDVNLAIAALGPPPDVPGPSTPNPGQVVVPPTTTPPPPVPPPPPGPSPKPKPTDVTRFPAPTGLKASNETASSVQLSWHNTPGTVGSDQVLPASYTVNIVTAKGIRASETTVSAPDATGGGVQTTVNGLKGKTSYRAQVWANGGKQAPPNSSVAFTTK